MPERMTNIFVKFHAAFLNILALVNAYGTVA
jgi:hypothetical protein